MVGGNYVNRFNLNGRSYEVIPQVPRAERLTPESLGQYYVKTGTGEPVPLSTVVSIDTATAPNALTQYNQLNSPSRPCRCRASPWATPWRSSNGRRMSSCRPTSSTLTSRIAPVRHRGQPAGDHLAFALVVIFLVLAAQFESLRDPLVILVSVPMSICGALLPLFFGLGT